MSEIGLIERKVLCSLNQCSFYAFKYGHAVPVSGRGGHQIPKIGVQITMLCWELNPGSLEKQQVSLSPEPPVHFTHLCHMSSELPRV